MSKRRGASYRNGPRKFFDKEVQWRSDVRMSVQLRRGYRMGYPTHDPNEDLHRDRIITPKRKVWQKTFKLFYDKGEK